MNIGIIKIDQYVHYSYICIVNKCYNLYKYEFRTTLKKSTNRQGVVSD